jgi:hypothetical protein
MTRPTCETCLYWELGNFSGDYAGAGACRRHAPRDPAPQGYVWPLTKGQRDWCGEHPDFPAYLAQKKGQGDE